MERRLSVSVDLQRNRKTPIQPQWHVTGSFKEVMTSAALTKTSQCSHDRRRRLKTELLLSTRWVMGKGLETQYDSQSSRSVSLSLSLSHSLSNTQLLDRHSDHRGSCSHRLPVCMHKCVSVTFSFLLTSSWTTSAAWMWHCCRLREAHWVSPSATWRSRWLAPILHLCLITTLIIC